MGLTFHRLIQRDLRNVLNYYEEEGGPALSKRFYQEFETVVRRIERNPRRFHLVSEVLRRANFPSFPFHLLFRESEEGTRILVLRHHRRKPDYGTQRQ
jgi:toxin ParE1/3/4